MAPKLPSPWRISKAGEEALQPRSVIVSFLFYIYFSSDIRRCYSYSQVFMVFPYKFLIFLPPCFSRLHVFPLWDLKLPGADLLENNLSKKQLQLLFPMSVCTSVSLDVETSPYSLVLIYLSNCSPSSPLKHGLVGICSFSPWQLWSCAQKCSLTGRQQAKAVPTLKGSGSHEWTLFTCISKWLVPCQISCMSLQAQCVETTLAPLPLLLNTGNLLPEATAIRWSKPFLL